MATTPAPAAEVGPPVPDARRGSPSFDESIAVELGGVTSHVRRSDVLFVQAHGDYARLHTATGSHLLRIPLSVLEQRWAEAGFVRIHRSTLVALQHVQQVMTDGGRLSVRLGGRILPVSRRHTAGVRELLAHRARRNREQPVPQVSSAPSARAGAGPAPRPVSSAVRLGPTRN